MKKRILIVDDEQRYIDRFTGYLQGEEVEIAAAQSLEQAIQIAEERQPAAATIDFGIGDHDGNDVGKALREMYPDIRMAGITGGEPESFDDDLFEIRARKSIDADQYVGIVRQLLGERRPEYRMPETTPVPLVDVAAIYLLVQGYNLVRKLQRGESVPELEKSGFQLPEITEECVRGLLDIGKITSLDPKEFYDGLCSRDPLLKSRPYADRFFSKIIDGKFDEVTDCEAESAESVLRYILEKDSGAKGPGGEDRY